jgi:CheY-like chemotaxis protein
MLRDLGYSVTEASNGREALRVVAQGKGRAFDLLVTDMIMPEMGGQQLAEELKVSHPKTKILFCSGYTNDAFTENGLLPPDVLFLQKPYTLNGLACKVREVLNN